MTTNEARQVTPPDNEYTEQPFKVPSADQITSMRALLDQMENASQQSAAGGVRRGRKAKPQATGAAAVTAPVTARPGRQKRSNTMTQTQSVPTGAQVIAPNAPTFDSLMQAVSELGTQAGHGVDVQIKFDLKVAEGGYLGSLSTDRNKHGQDIDDATQLAEAYWKARNGVVVFDAKAPNQRKTVATVRKMIKLGTCPKWGVGEPMATVNKLITLRQSLRKDPANAKKLDDAHNALMRFATTQLKRDTIMDDAELRTFCFKRDPDPRNPRNAAEVLEAIRKTANNLKTGKVSNCPDLDDSAEVQAIINACTKRLVAIAKAKQSAA